MGGGWDWEPPPREAGAGDPGRGGGPALLGDRAPPLDLDVRDRVHLELENPVREERLVPPGLRRLEPEERGVGRRLREDEGRPAEVPQPLEEPEQFRSPVLKLREDLERLERVDGQEVHAINVLLRRQRAAKELHPRLRGAFADLFLNRADVDNVQIAAHRLDVEAHRGHLPLQARAGLLKGHVQALRMPVPRVPMEDRVRQGRLHRPRQAGDEDNVARWQTAAEQLVESVDERGDFLRLQRRLPPRRPGERDPTPTTVHSPPPPPRIVSTCRAARSIAMSTNPKFASSYTRATRSASSPAPRLRSFPSSDSMIARTNRPWSSWMVAISDVPTIAAVMAATILGSTPSGRVCVTTRPSRRTTAADLMSVTRESSSIVSSRRPQTSLMRTPPRFSGWPRSTAPPSRCEAERGPCALCSGPLSQD